MKLKPKSPRFWKLLGPGLITGASDDDPSGIATYSQAGAAFGLSTLWTALFTFPMMAAIQEMCARIGLVTNHGLTGTLKQYYSKPVVALLVLFSFPAITLNIGADIAGMGAVANLLLPSVPAFLFSILFTAILIFSIILLPYRAMANTLKWLCMALFCYLIIPFLFKQDWYAIISHTIIPTFRLEKNFLAIIVGILGTTISPYLFFWQASVEVEEMQQRKLIVDKIIIHDMKFDVRFGMFFSNLIMFFIILATGTVLFNANVREIDTVEQAATALRPLAGDSAYILFAIGIIGTGFLAIPVLAGSLSYIITEAFGWEEGMNKKFHEAKGFYIVIIISMLVALLINFTGISPVQSLIYTAVLYGLTAPVIIAIIMHISNNKIIMGENTNDLPSNIIGTVTLLLMTIAAGLLIYFMMTGDK